jgi:hypothetical protein
MCDAYVDFVPPMSRMNGNNRVRDGVESLVGVHVFEPRPPQVVVVRLDRIGFQI